jgi:hypothetical protein
VQRARRCQVNSRTTKHGFKFNIFAVEKIILLNSSVGVVVYQLIKCYRGNANTYSRNTSHGPT